MAIHTKETGPQEITIVLGDTFDFNCVEEFRRAYESADNGTARDFIVDFRNTNYMDSSALGMLINMDKFWQDRGTTIRLVNPNPQVKKIFTISRFDKKFVIE